MNIYVRRSATLVMTKEQYKALKDARVVLRELYDALDEDESIGNTCVYELEDIDIALGDIIDAGEAENDEVKFEVR